MTFGGIQSRSFLGADSRNTVVILSGRNWEMMEDAKGQKNLSSLWVFIHGWQMACYNPYI